MLSKEEMIKRMQQEFEEQGDQQEIVDFHRNHAELKLYKYGEMKIEPDVITYNGKIYVAIDSLNPTIEEVKKEWEIAGYKWKESDWVIYLTHKDFSTYWLRIRKDTKTYEGCVNFQIHKILIKTIKALEREEKE